MPKRQPLNVKLISNWNQISPQVDPDDMTNISANDNACFFLGLIACLFDMNFVGSSTFVSSGK